MNDPVAVARWLLKPSRCLGLLLLCLTLCDAVAQAGEPLHFTAAEILSVEGRGYSAPPYAINASGLPGAWQSVSLPHAVLPDRIEAALNDDRAEALTKVTWYRLQVPMLETASEPRYLYIPRWKTDGQLAVYGDGRLLYQSHASMSWNGWNIPLWIALDETENALAPHVILLRIERPRMSGGGISSVWLGEENSLGWRYRLRDVLQVQLPLMSSAAFLAVGLFSLFVWLRHRDQSLYLLFFFVSLTSYLRSMHFYLGAERLPIPDDWFSWLTVNSLFWMLLTVHYFLNYLHRHPLAWLNRTVSGVTLAISIATLPFFSALPHVYILSSLAYVVLLLMGTTVATVGLRKSLQVQSRDGILLASWGLLGMMFGLYDWLLQNNYVSIEGSYVGSYSNIIAFLIFSYIMFHRYVGAIEDVNRVNATLELRLQAREAELTGSHRRLREIEQRQTLSQERQRMVQDMHDGLGSSLVSALRVVEHGRMDEAAVAQVLKGCIDDLKLAIDSMEPVEADLLLLLATLRFRLGPRLESTGIALRWEVKNVPPLDWLDPKNALHILRILQETFTNIIKHTHATEILVATGVEGDHAVVTITDNGSGFSVESALKNGGKGLSNQMRRAQAVGAEINLESNDAGTRFTLRLPIKRATGIAG
jgi:signal transduction histidine kinase